MDITEDCIVDTLTNHKYPNLGLIKSFTGKKIICRLDFSKVSVNDIFRNLKNKINYEYRGRQENMHTLGLKPDYKPVLWEDKDTPLKNLGCNKQIEHFIMMFNEGNKNNEYALTKELLDKSNNSLTKVSVVTLTGSTSRVGFTSDMTTTELKILMTSKLSIPYDQARFIYQGKQIEDGRELSDYSITDNSDIHMVLRLRGGMFHETSGRNGNYIPLQDCIVEIDPIENI